ncbi:uncharacterized protein LOC110821258 [Carica papaya]|uniref:uncharacterized protein LOC110821258 n=1 Tax=Carica papaya TaxID=3649 RepID=UPI000B8C7D6D|nr:uncharacterized protein LOC110821258 [Carica papaya]
MVHIAPRERDFEVDLEKGGTVSEDRVGLCCNVSNPAGVSGQNVNSPTNRKLEGGEAKNDVYKSVEKDKHKKSSNKKAPKPPRPPRGPSLDAADQKLIREIAELAMLKRARIERMKALKKMKAAKASSSSNGNLFAILFTILFCLVIIFQGMSSNKAPKSFQGSAVPAGRADNGLISVQYVGNPSMSEPNAPGSGFPNLLQQTSGMDPGEKLVIGAG